MPPSHAYAGRQSIDSTHVGMAQVAMQRVAAQVMNYMAKRGSKLKVLAVSPYLQPTASTCLDKDENGHRWPNYYYLRGRNTDARGIEHITALPLAYVSLEMPESTIINEK